MKKKHLLLLLPFLLVSCGDNIPDGPKKDFIEAINFDETFKAVNKAANHIVTETFENNISTGKVDAIYNMDKSNKLNYYYSKAIATGSYIGEKKGQYKYGSSETLSYLKDNLVFSFAKNDGQVSKLTYTEEDTYTAVQNFFYNKLDSYYHSGGMFYGDYVSANLGRYYDLFTLNEEKNEMSYQVNTRGYDEDNNEIIVQHKFTINSLGMLMNSSSITHYKVKKLRIETNVTCDYNPSFEILTNLGDINEEQ